MPMYVVHPKLGFTSTKLSRPVTSILIRGLQFAAIKAVVIHFCYNSQVSLFKESILSDVENTIMYTSHSVVKNLF